MAKQGVDAQCMGSVRLAQTDVVTDLCRPAGISERTLQYAFKEVMGLSRRDYLVRLRLHRVRVALLAASQRSAPLVGIPVVGHKEPAALIEQMSQER
jgi:AraC-like DNA-binding protein